MKGTGFQRRKALKLAAGWGGIAAVSRITGIARSTIGRGLDELEIGGAPNGQVRRAGAGRKLLEETDPRLIEDLERIVAPTQRGDPEQPLRWTIKSLRQIARALRVLGHGISHTSVGAVLRACSYSLQANRKTREGSHHPDRNAQFEYINQTVSAALGEVSQRSRSTPRRRSWLGISEHGPDLASPGSARTGAYPRFPDPGAGQGRPLRGLRHRRE
jgi:hypothetical protein